MANQGMRKIWLLPDVFELIWKDERNYVISESILSLHVGDSLLIEEGNEVGVRTGRQMESCITAVSRGGREGLPDGLCVFGVLITAKRSRP